MVAWFEGQPTTGEGAYSRETPNTSAKRAYNRLLCALALIWIADALGVPSSRVAESVDAVLTADGDHRRACEAIRKVLPGELVAEQAVARERPEDLSGGGVGCGDSEASFLS